MKQTRIFTILGIIALSLGTSSWAFEQLGLIQNAPRGHAPRACKVSEECGTPSSDGIHELSSYLSLQGTDNVVLFTQDVTFAHRFNEAIKVHDLTVVIADEDSCQNLEKRFGGNDAESDETKVSNNVQVICGGVDSVDLSRVNVIIVHALDLASRDFVQKVVALPDGVRLVTRQQLDDHPSLRLDGICTVAISPTVGMIMYVYAVKRPTVSELLSDVYYGMSGFCITHDEAQCIRDVGGDPTYGEITFSAAEKLFTEIISLNSNDVFYDLGSGIGKLVLWVYLATPAKKAVGVELSESRFAMSERALKIVRETVLPERKMVMREAWGDTVVKKKVVEFERGDITKVDLNDATVIFMCATCFSDGLMKTMVERFAQLKDGLRIVTLKEFPAHDSFHLLGTYRLPMTWSSEKGSPVYVYEMRHPHLKDVLEKSYEGVSGHSVPEEDVERVKAQGGAPTYGEITYDSAKILFEKVLRVGPQDVFYDLGSGVGKLVMQAFLETPVKLAVGVELSETRFQAAQDATERAKKTLQEEPYMTLWQEKWGSAAETKEIRFMNTNISGADLSEATVIFTCSTCFSSELMKDIAGLCESLRDGARVASLKKLDGCSRLQLVKTHRLAMSWSKDVEVYEYKVSSKAQAPSSKKQAKSLEVKPQGAKHQDAKPKVAAEKNKK